MIGTTIEEFKKIHESIENIKAGKEGSMHIGKIAKYLTTREFPAEKFTKEIGTTPHELTYEAFKTGEKYSENNIIDSITIRRFKILQLAYDGRNYEPALEKLEKLLSKEPLEKDFISNLRYREITEDKGSIYTQQTEKAPKDILSTLRTSEQIKNSSRYIKQRPYKKGAYKTKRF